MLGDQEPAGRMLGIRNSREIIATALKYWLKGALAAQLVKCLGIRNSREIIVTAIR
jgi:hypothetical protein